ncbi:MAG TPA: hypothetical protein VNT99_16625 [Methylomirabilota bacterium]|nr:hypothetical protein [Methylomirabilota bacterium]
MKRLLAALAIAIVVGMVWWLKTTDGPQPVPPTVSEIPLAPAENQPATAAISSEADPPDAVPDTPILGPPGAVLPKPKPMSLTAVEELPPQLEAPETGEVLAPVTALENMRTTLRQYSLRFGGNPVGDNAEITAALSGNNPKQVTFLAPDDGARINGKGQLVDNWDSPYFFHQLSRTEMEIQSAGPDRRMWTADDLVLK